MVAGSNPARGAKFRNKLNDLLLRPDVTRDAVRAIFQGFAAESSAESHSNRCVRQCHRGHQGGAKST
jgi:hypothetical protein